MIYIIFNDYLYKKKQWERNVFTSIVSNSDKLLYLT